MITTTLNRISAHGPRQPGWEKLLKHLGKTEADDEPLSFLTILESNGLEDALWCCRCEPKYGRKWRLLAVRCARRVQHLMKDPRSIAALDVAERHAKGEATDEELEAAAKTAWDAVETAWYGATAARAAWDAAWDGAMGAARAATGDAERHEQEKMFREMLEEENADVS